MNKKKLLVLLPAALLALSGCNPSEPSSSEKSSEASQVVSSAQGGNTSSKNSVSSEEPKKTYQVTITQVEHAHVEADKTQAEVGETITFTVTTDEDYHVSSFKVNGNDVALKDNKATVQMVENGLTITIAVEANTHDVTIHSSENGTVVADKTTAIVGDKVTFTITPNDDFELDTFKVNGEAKEVTNNTYETTMVKEGLTVDATFKAIKHAVTINKNAGGTVTADKMEAITGEDVTLTVTPDADYHLSALYVNGNAVSVGESGTVVVKMVKTGLIVSGVFAKKRAPITVIDTKGGTIRTSSETDAPLGEEIEIQVYADDGYELDKLLVNGEETEVDSEGYAYVNMVEGGLTITATWKELAKTITIVPCTNGTVTANKEKATVGESVTFTISPAEGYHLESFKVNGHEEEVTGNSYVTNMTEEGLSIEATFSDTYRVASISDSLKTTIKGLDTAKVTLTADSTIDTIPLAKKDTIIDLGGKTLTVTSAVAIYALAAEDGTHVQNITVKNGTINVTGASANGNIINASDALSFTLDGVTLTNTTLTYTGIYCSSSTDLEIKNSTLDLKAIFGIGTNNLEGKNAKIVMDNSHLTVTTDDKDNAAFLGNVEGINVTFKNSTLQADRQAVVARTGTWKADATTFEITGAWLTEANKAKNDSYLTGTWKAGNEVPSAAAVIGDNVAGAYNEDVNFAFTNSCKFVAPAGNKVVSRVDGTHSTTINFDALTYVNAYDSMDNDTGVNVVTPNVLTKTITEMNALTVDADSNNFYVVTGTVKRITSTSNGSCIIEDPTTHEEFTIFEGWKSGCEYTLNKNAYYLNKADSKKPVSKSDIGKTLTFIGLYKNYNGTKETTYNLAFIKDETVANDLTASATVNDATMGEVTLSKTSGITYGETINVTVTPKEGYKLSKVTYTDGANKETDITDSLSFAATYVNKVEATFVSNDTKEAKVYNVAFNSTNNQQPVGSYTKKWTNISDGITYELANFNNNNNKDWSYVKCGRKDYASVASIANKTALPEAIGKASLTIDSMAKTNVNSIKLIVSSDAAFGETSIIETHALDISKNITGKVDVTIENPTANAFYKWVFDCKSSTKNGFIVVSALSFTEAI